VGQCLDQPRKEGRAPPTKDPLEAKPFGYFAGGDTLATLGVRCFTQFKILRATKGGTEE
jgi:hypothetical protein